MKKASQTDGHNTTDGGGPCCSQVRRTGGSSTRKKKDCCRCRHQTKEGGEKPVCFDCDTAVRGQRSVPLFLVPLTGLRESGWQEFQGRPRVFDCYCGFMGGMRIPILSLFVPWPGESSLVPCSHKSPWRKQGRRSPISWGNEGCGWVGLGWIAST